MKKYIVLFSLMFSMLLWTSNANAQTAPPPPDTHGQNTDQVAGGSAPIGGGLFILLGLGIAYGGKKWYDHRKTSLEVSEE